MIEKNSDNIRGAFFMAACMAAFGINDALMKLGSEHFSLVQAIFVRSIFTTVLIGAFAYYKGAFKSVVPSKDRKLIAVRVAAEVCGAYFFLTAIFNMPLANATAILQSLPLAVTLGAGLFLGEKIGWRRYGAILIGFTGVLIIVRPGAEGFNSYAFYAVAAIGFIVVRDLSTRRISSSVSSLLVSFLTSLAIMIVAGALLPFSEWTPLSVHNVSFLLAASFFVVFGYVLSVSSVRVGEIAFVSPFRYTILLWSILLGIVLFGDYPDQWTIVGSSIVVAMGIYTFYREQKRSKA
ncbi:DMT family transporter [Sneathiella sp.]|jgi:drug/metabolite transporter (DMT)-like permease|uniref:DMT family transporter n=1 Tax=Sneathiella sp. TaxID=1964365 RepID=UPI0039E457D8